MSVIKEVALPAVAGGAIWSCEIGHSALLDGVDDYLSRTPASTGNRKTWTFSTWFKPCDLDYTTAAVLLSAVNGSANTEIYLDGAAPDGRVVVQHYDDGHTMYVKTDAVFVDPTAHYHLLVHVDTTQAADTDRAKIWVNGVQITAGASPTWPAQNFETNMNSTVPHAVGARASSALYKLESYLSETHLVDGQALTPDAFGEWSGIVSGLWAPKAYTGAYGTNGFRLDFGNAADLGADVSGNGNDWTVNGSPMQTLDTPTNTYPTLNPLHWLGSRATPVTFSEGNLRVVQGASAYGHYASTIALPKVGKWYFECAFNSDYPSCGVGGSANMNVAWAFSGTIYTATTHQTGITPVLGSGDVVSVLYDADAATVTFMRNNMAHGTAVDISAHMADDLFAMAGDWDSASATDITARFGATGFTYAPPDGLLPLCAANLPDPAILRSSTVADIVLREGTGAAANVASLEFQPDFVNIKDRDTTHQWMLFDSVRGAAKYLNTNGTNPEGADAETLKSFNAAGYTLGSTTWMNQSGDSFLDLCLKAGVGQGFEIVAYAGTGVARTVAHNLGKAPTFMLVKRLTNGGGNWLVYHTALGDGKYLVLNGAGAVGTGSYVDQPTSMTFRVGDQGDVNAVGESYAACLFADSDIFKAFSYTGNGLADGPFVNLGGRPLAIPFWKGCGTTNWFNFDAMRNPNNPIDHYLLPSAPNAEGTDTYAHFTSAGMKIQTALGGREHGKPDLCGPRNPAINQIFKCILGGYHVETP